MTFSQPDEKRRRWLARLEDEDKEKKEANANRDRRTDEKRVMHACVGGEGKVRREVRRKEPGSIRTSTEGRHRAVWPYALQAEWGCMMHRPASRQPDRRRGALAKRSGGGRNGKSLIDLSVQYYYCTPSFPSILYLQL
jgi:hypothetical protein